LRLPGKWLHGICGVLLGARERDPETRHAEAGENIVIFATAGTAIDLPPLPPALCKSEND
jgi:hypothetical protein